MVADAHDTRPAGRGQHLCVVNAVNTRGSCSAAYTVQQFVRASNERDECHWHTALPRPIAGTTRACRVRSQLRATGASCLAHLSTQTCQQLPALPAGCHLSQSHRQGRLLLPAAAQRQQCCGARGGPPRAQPPGRQLPQLQHLLQRSCNCSAASRVSTACATGAVSHRPIQRSQGTSQLRHKTISTCFANCCCYDAWRTSRR